MKKLLCILSSMNAGGAETFLMKIYRAIDREQYQMDFCINVQEKCFYEDEITALGGRIYRIPYKSENVRAFKGALTNIVKQNSYKYVLRITSNAMGFMDLQIAKKAGAEVCAVRSSNASDGGGWKVSLAHRLGRLLYDRFVDVKIAPSALAAQYTFGKKAYNSDEVIILRNAIDTSVYCFNKEKRTVIRKELCIADNARVIGHIGRFVPQKNHGYLLDIFAQIKKRDNCAVLLLVGEGELEMQIREKLIKLELEESVLFTGVRSDIPDLLSAMDVFVFPSLYEGMPNTVIEAQAVGLPCVIADTITREANITGLVTYLSLTDSPADWAEKALSVSEKVRCSQEEAFVENHYDIHSAVNDFISMVF